jgi:hypothetical protein
MGQVTDREPLELTKFEAWAKRFGASELAAQLANRGQETRTSLGMVYAWIRGEHEPRAAKRRVILQLAKDELTADDLVAHFEAKSRKPATAAPSAPDGACDEK